MTHLFLSNSAASGPKRNMKISPQLGQRGDTPFTYFTKDATRNELQESLGVQTGEISRL